MKIAVDGQCFSAYGVAPAQRQFVRDLLLAFHRSSGGAMLETLVLDRQSEIELRNDRLTARRVDLPPVGDSLRRVCYADRINQAYRNALLDSPPDLLLLPDLVSPEIAFVEPFAGLPNIAILSDMPRTDTARSLTKAKIDRLREARAWFFVSSVPLQDWLKTACQIPENRIGIISPPVDMQRFRPADPVREKRGRKEGESEDPGAYALTLANDETEANLGVVFRAFSRIRLRTETANLLVASEDAGPDMGRRVKRMADDAGVAPERWAFAQVDSTSFADLLRDARVFLYPAEADHLGAPLLQALASGVATLCSETGALAELAGTAALTGSPHNETDIGDRLERLLRQKPERDAWAAKGPPRAAKFDARQCASRMQRAFHSEYRAPAQLSGDLKVALVSPFPNQETGVAHYSMQMAKELREFANLEIYTTQEEKNDPILTTWFPVFKAEDLPQRHSKYDIIVYHMGNNAANHGVIFQLLSRFPGAVILHDINLHGFFYSQHRERKRGFFQTMHDARRGLPVLEGDPYYDEMVYCYGDAGAELARSVIADNLQSPEERLFLNRRITRRSRAVITHSRWAAERLIENGDPASIHVLPHGAQVEPQYDKEAARQFRKKLEALGGHFILAVAGFQNPNRRTEAVFRAMAELKKRGVRPVLAIIGRQSPGMERMYREFEAQLGLEKDIVATGYIEAHDEFLGHLAAADIVVNLRYPTVGETSGILMHALALGKPVIVSDTPVNAELPADAVARIAVDDLEVESLAATLEALGRDPDLRLAMGKAARHYIATTCDWPIVIRQMSHILYEVARRYAYAPSAA